MMEDFTPRRKALTDITVLSQYQHQVHLIRGKLVKALENYRARQKPERMPRMRSVREIFEAKKDELRQLPVPSVTSVIRSQGENRLSELFSCFSVKVEFERFEVKLI